MRPPLPSLYAACLAHHGVRARARASPAPLGKECTGALRGWERGSERLPPGYRLDTTDAAIWVLRRPDDTAVSYFCAWSATREAVERAAREDHRTRSKRSTPTPPYPPR